MQTKFRPRPVVTLAGIFIVFLLLSGSVGSIAPMQSPCSVGFTLNPASGSAAPGGFTSFDLRGVANGPCIWTVRPSLAQAVNGITLTSNPASLLLSPNGSGTARATVSVAANVPVGVYELTIRLDLAQVLGERQVVLPPQFKTYTLQVLTNSRQPRAQITTDRGCREKGQNPVYFLGEPLVTQFRLDGAASGLATIEDILPNGHAPVIFRQVVPGNRTLSLAGTIEPPLGQETLQLTVQAGELTARDKCSFTVAPQGKIVGYKFEDANGNKSWERDRELGIAGWRITLTGPESQSTTTDANGRFEFTIRTPGTYTVSEETRPGWQATTPASVTITVRLFRGETFAEILFGNQKRCAKIVGFKFHDLNGNQVWEGNPATPFIPGNEPPIKGWEITLTGPEGVKKTKTDDKGRFEFVVCTPGEYKVTEENRTGWDAITPASVTVTVRLFAGETFAEILFGNQQRCTKLSGFKFFDLNGNGVWEGYPSTPYIPGEEPPIKGWEITLTGPEGVKKTKTDDKGRFEFIVCTPGEYKVTEENRPGWQATTAASVTVIVRLFRGETFAEILFGNDQPCTVTISETPLAYLPRNTNTVEHTATIAPPLAVDIIEFRLVLVSSYRGDAMNHGRQVGADLEFRQADQVDPNIVVTSPTSARTRLPVNSATVVTRALDFGARGLIEAQACEMTTLPRDIPRDTDGDTLPDAWEIANGLNPNNPDTDADGTPDGQEDDDANPAVVGVPALGRTGDGLVAFEEYRGFFVNGAHTRTDPRQKNLFAHSTVTDGLGNALGLGFLQNSPLTVHAIRNDEWDGPNARAINFNRQGIPAATPQRALRIIEDNTLGAGELGYTGRIAIDSGPDGVANSAAAGDDIQVIPVGQGEPNTVIIEAGPDGVLDTPAAAGDDVREAANNRITSGPNGIAETAAAVGDIPVIPVGQGRPHSVVLLMGPNATRDSATGGDDVGYPAGIAVGAQPTVNELTPNERDVCRINVAAHNAVQPGPDGIAGNADDVDLTDGGLAGLALDARRVLRVLVILETIAHEAGHGHAITHYFGAGGGHAAPWSVMFSLVVIPVPFNYDARDREQIRLHRKHN